MQEPSDPSLAQPGTGEAQPNPDTVVSSAGQPNASPQNDVPANFVEINQILEEPSPDEGETETETEDEKPSPDEEEPEKAEWPPADKNHPYWQKMQALQEDIQKSEEAVRKAEAEVRRVLYASRGAPSSVFDDLHAEWLGLAKECDAKKKQAAEEEKKMREEASTENDKEEVTDDSDSSVEEQSQPQPAARFKFTVGGAPGKAAGLTAVQDLLRIEDEIEAFRFTSTEDGVIDLFREEDFYPGRFLHEYSVLPISVSGFGTTRQLFDSILALLQKHVMLPRKESSLLTYWAIATWFTDDLPFVPCLAISGPTSTADLLLRTLRAVCRRPVLLADLSPAILRALPISKLMPTLLIRQPQLNKQIALLLDASNQPGYWFFNGGGFRQLYCPKCIYVGERLKGQPIGGSSIPVYVGGSLLRSLHPLPTENEILHVQNQLLAYRLLGHDKVAASNFRVPGFRPELCAMAEVLGAAIVDDPELQRGVIDVLKDHDEQSRVDRASGLDGVVLRAVLSHCHQKDQQKLFVRQIATTVNGIYHEEGESLKVNSEKVGHVLKQLGLFTGRLGNSGRGLVLDNSTRSQAHRLGHSYDVLDFENACAHCHELQLSESKVVVQDV